MKKCSPPLVINEMQIKTTSRFYLTFVRMVTIKNTKVGIYIGNVGVCGI
jgi:hypothetical protein